MAEDNKTVNDSGTSDVAYPVIELYVAFPVRLVTSAVILFFTTIVLLTIKKNRNIKRTFHYFFVSNLMFSDIAVALISNLSAAVLILYSTINRASEGIKCATIRASSFPYIASFGMLAALAFDRMIVTLYPTRYRQIISKQRAYVLVTLIWLGSLFISFLAYADQNLDVKTKTAVCSSDYYNYIIFGIVLIFIGASVVFVIVQNVYNFSLALVDTRSLREYGTTSSEPRNIDRTAEFRDAFTLFWETQKPSIAALILVGTDVLLYIIALPILLIVAKMFPDSALSALIWSILGNLMVYSAIGCHSFLYSWFLDSFTVVFGWQRCRIPMLSCTEFTGSPLDRPSRLREH